MGLVPVLTSYVLRERNRSMIGESKSRGDRSCSQQGKKRGLVVIKGRGRRSHTHQFHVLYFS